MDALGSVNDVVARYGYTVVLVGTIIDGIGIPFPGRLMLVVAGALAERANLDLGVLIALGTLGALAGDHVWYLAGRLDQRRRLLALYCRVVPGRGRCVDRARAELERLGPFAFVVGRLFAAVRILAAPVAAAAGIGYRQFLLYDAAGALVWSAAFVLLGHVLGARAPAVIREVGTFTAIAGVVLIALSVTALVVWRRRST